jgi:hypothetical protein
MSKELRVLINENEREVQQLVTEYKGIENEILSKLNSVGKELDKIETDLGSGVEISKSGLFNYNGSRVYKYSISKNGNKVWVQFVKEEIHLYLNYYLQEGTDSIFREILTELNFPASIEVNYNQNKSELVNIFSKHVRIINESFRIYDVRKENE